MARPPARSYNPLQASSPDRIGAGSKYPGSPGQTNPSR